MNGQSWFKKVKLTSFFRMEGVCFGSCSVNGLFQKTEIGLTAVYHQLSSLSLEWPSQCMVALWLFS
jgi:hypothetical protein